MRIIETIESYKSKKISKQEYIDAMYTFHAHLFDYTKVIPHTDIEKIEIVDNKIIITFRESGIKLSCQKPDKRIAPMEVLNFNYYEKENSDMIFRLIEQEFNVFDIGASIGWYTLNIAKQFDRAKVLAFEPIFSTFDQLKQNVKINSLNNITIYNFGFSNQETKLTFYLEPESSVSASAANISNKSDVEKVTCCVKKLDDFVNNYGIKPDFIKCDVEGAELHVYQGGIETINRYKPIVFTEMLRKWSAKFNYHPNQIIDLLSNIGYKCFVVKDNYLSEIHRMDGNTLETNFFFLHMNKHASKLRSLVK